jgi:NAD(P)-dependent dehydrogenase (short-subunit alcohol dehydrogenase family)
MVTGSSVASAVAVGVGTTTAVFLTWAYLSRKQKSATSDEVLFWDQFVLRPAQSYARQIRQGQSLNSLKENNGWDEEYPLANAIALSDGQSRPVTFLITGGTNGIGHSLVLALTKLGGHVIVIGRSAAKLESLKQEVERRGFGSVQTLVADLQDLDQVKRVADIARTQCSALDVLICNAGIHDGPEKVLPTPPTPQGYDRVFVTNYLSHFLLCEKLRPLLAQAPLPSIIQTSSTFHWAVDGSDLVPPPAPPSSSEVADSDLLPLAARPGGGRTGWVHATFRTQRSYSNSKLAQICHMRGLQQRQSTTAEGVNKIRCVSYCPAWVGTSIVGPGLYPLVSRLGFSSTGWGISSAMTAIFGTCADAASLDGSYNDYYSNNALFVLSQRIRTELPHWMYRYGVRDMLVAAVGITSLMLQSLFPRVYALKSSPESYNPQVQKELYEWSTQAIKQYLV